MKRDLPPNVLDAVSDYAIALDYSTACRDAIYRLSKNDNAVDVLLQTLIDSVRAQLKAEQKLNAAGYSESDIDQLYYEIQ